MSGYQPNQGIGAIPRQDIGSLNAPGLAAPTRVYSSASEKLDHALAIMGQGGQVFNQASVMVARDRELHDQQLKGQAVQQWNVDRVLAKQQIDQGEYAIGDKADEKEVQAANAAVAAQFVDGKPKAYVDHYMSIASGETSAWLAGARIKRQNQAVDNATYDLIQAATENATAEDHVKTYQQLEKLHPEWTQAQLMLQFVQVGNDAAARGDAGKVATAIEFLGNRNPDAQAKWHAMLVQQANQKAAAELQGIQDQHAEFLAEGKLEEAGVYLDTQHEKGNIQGEAFLKLKSASIAAKDKQRTADQQKAVQGFKDAVAAGMPPEQASKSIEHYRSIYGSEFADKLVKEHQYVYANNLKRDIGLGRFAPGKDGKPDVNATMQGVINDMDRPSNDPLHISAELGASILAQTEKRLKFDAQSVVVAARLGAPENSGGLPLGPQQDGALVTIMANQYGVLQGVPGKDGAIEPTAIIAPTKFAKLSDKAGRVPKEVAGLIQRGMGGDAAQIASAAQSLAALQEQNPRLADQVIDGMEPLAQMRARELQSKVDLGRWAKPPNDSAANLQQNLQTNQRELQAIASMQYKPVSSAQFEQAAFGADAKERPATKQKILNDALSIPEHEWLRFKDYKPAMNSAQREEFFRIYEQEWQTALSRTGSDQQANAIATKKAGARFANNHQAIVWNGQAFTSDAPRHLSDPTAFKDAVESGLKDAGWTNRDHINDVLNSTTPVWNPTQKAWQFNDQLGNPYTYSTPEAFGKVLYISLIKADGAGKYTPEKVKELESKIRAFRASKEKPLRESLDSASQKVSEIPF